MEFFAFKSPACGDIASTMGFSLLPGDRTPTLLDVKVSAHWTMEEVCTKKKVVSVHIVTRLVDL